MQEICNELSNSEILLILDFYGLLIFHFEIFNSLVLSGEKFKPLGSVF